MEEGFRKGQEKSNNLFVTEIQGSHVDYNLYGNNIVKKKTSLLRMYQHRRRCDIEFHRM